LRPAPHQTEMLACRPGRRQGLVYAASPQGRSVPTTFTVWTAESRVAPSSSTRARKQTTRFFIPMGADRAVLSAELQRWYVFDISAKPKPKPKPPDRPDGQQPHSRPPPWTAGFGDPSPSLPSRCAPSPTGRRGTGCSTCRRPGGDIEVRGRVYVAFPGIVLRRPRRKEGKGGNGAVRWSGPRTSELPLCSSSSSKAHRLEPRLPDRPLVVEVSR
jgi:hypothetical protein